MLEDDALVCNHCEKIIRHERPLFCPYCGKPIDATQGLLEKGDEAQLYPWSQLAPFAMRIFLYWLVLALGLTAWFGRKVLPGLLGVLLLIYLVRYLAFRRRFKER